MKKMIFLVMIFGAITLSANHSDGRYEWRTSEVWVPAKCERVWNPPRYEWRVTRCGRYYKVQTCSGYYSTRRVAGYYTTKTVRVWVPAPRRCNKTVVYTRTKCNKPVYRKPTCNKTVIYSQDSELLIYSKYFYLAIYFMSI